MRLTLFITFSVLIAHLIRFSLYNFFHSWSLHLHLDCVSSLPQHSKALPELKALVCGSNFDQLSFSNLYIATGLIHLFVVSGAHLILIKKILDLTARLTALKKISNFIVLVALIYFAAACEFNPPVTRSLLSILLADQMLFKKNFWPGHFKILITGLLTLFFNTEWIVSLSLQLSWLIALSLLLNEEFLKTSSILIRQTLNYFLILPTLMYFQVPHPAIILIHVLFSSFLELILFPLALLVRFIHFLFPVFDLLIMALKNILAKTELEFQPQLSESPPGLIIFNWALILGLHLFLHFHFIKKERKKSCSAFE